MNKRDNIIKWSIISIFIGLYALVSCISTIHVIDFFRLSNPNWLAITLAIAFEVGAAASLAAIVILDKTSRSLVWFLFILITLMQMMGNMYYAYVHLENFRYWSELFGLIEEEEIFQKRILSFVSGAILPIVALGFIKSLVDYIRPAKVEDIRGDFEKRKAIQEELERESALIKSEQPNIEEIDEPIEENPEDVLEPIISESKSEDQKIEDIQNDTEISETERMKQLERKIKQVISENPELKEKISEKLKEIESGDKYTKTESSVQPEPVVRRTYGGM